jgi:hypothetical protein
MAQQDKAHLPVQTNYNKPRQQTSRKRKPTDDNRVRHRGLPRAGGPHGQEENNNEPAAPAGGESQPMTIVSQVPIMMFSDIEDEEDEHRVMLNQLLLLESYRM